MVWAAAQSGRRNKQSMAVVWVGNDGGVLVQALWYRFAREAERGSGGSGMSMVEWNVIYLILHVQALIDQVGLRHAATTIIGDLQGGRLHQGLLHLVPECSFSGELTASSSFPRSRTPSPKPTARSRTPPLCRRPHLLPPLRHGTHQKES